MAGRFPAVLFLGALLAGCIAHGRSLPQADAALADLEKVPPTPAAFAYCSDHNCENQHRVHFSPVEWAEVTAPLAEPPEDAAAEREALRHVVGRFERAAGRQAGTGEDRAGTMVFPPRGQLDCVDESVNTTRLLAMLEDAGLLRFHQPGWPIHRAFVGKSRTHLTAVIREKGGGSWALDSWFRDAGEPADVIELERWLEGWEPPDADA